MGLVAVIDAVNARLTAILAGLTPPQAAPQYTFGESTLGEQDSPPRVTWVPRSGPIGKSSGRGGDGVTAPRVLLGRSLTFEVHFWVAADSVDGAGGGSAEDFTAAEELHQHFVAALHDICHGSYHVGSEGWMTGASENNRLGVVGILIVTLHAPLVREPEPAATVTTFEQIPVVLPQT